MHAWYTSSLHIDQASLTAVTIAADVAGEVTESLRIRFDVTHNVSGKSVVAASATGVPGANVGIPVGIPVPSPRVWHPSDPHLYDVIVTLLRQPQRQPAHSAGEQVAVAAAAVAVGSDCRLGGGVLGRRPFTLGHGLPGKGRRPQLNGNATFLTEFLDQSCWPDGLHTAPTDEALAYDVEVAPSFGLNMIRLHQKVNPE